MVVTQLDPTIAAIIETAATSSFGVAGGAGAKLVIGVIGAIAARQSALGRTMSHDELLTAVRELVEHPLPMPVDVAGDEPT